MTYLTDNQILRILSGDGTSFFDDASPHTITCDSIQMDTDTIIEELYEKGNATNLIVAANSDNDYNFSGATLLTGRIIFSRAGKPFTKFKLTSGSVVTNNSRERSV